jgi:HlyD family secretion protein
MIKFIIIPLGLILIAGSFAVVDQRSTEHAPTAKPISATLPGQIFATGIVEGRTEDVELRPEASGRVDEVSVHLGDWVEAGQVLLRLDDRTQRAQVAVSQANLQLAQANLDRLVNGARETERQEARALLTAKKARLHQARLTWQRVQTLRAQAAIAQQEADDQEGVVLALTAEEEAAEARLNQLDAPARDDELRAAQARVAAVQAEYELAAIALDRTSLRAPTRSQVLDVCVEPGETITAGRTEPVIVLSDTSQLRVRAYVEEIDAPRITAGMSANVKADGLSGKSFAAIVRSVSPRMDAKKMATGQSNELYDTKLIEAMLDLSDSQGLILGLRVDVVIQLTGK